MSSDPQRAAEFEVPPPRFASRGRAYVYVVPCRNDSLYKIGYARDPLVRLRTLQRRFFEFFDLDRAVLVETDRVRDARAIERHLLIEMADWTALAPPVVPTAAAGHGEWFRGSLDEARALALSLAGAGGCKVHDPASVWFRRRLDDARERLYAWSLRVLDAIEYAEQHARAEESRDRRMLECALIDTLDAFRALAIDVRPNLADPVIAWYAAHAPSRDR